MKALHYHRGHDAPNYRFNCSCGWENCIDDNLNADRCMDNPIVQHCVACGEANYFRWKLWEQDLLHLTEEEDRTPEVLEMWECSKNSEYCHPWYKADVRPGPEGRCPDCVYELDEDWEMMPDGSWKIEVGK